MDLTVGSQVTGAQADDDEGDFERKEKEKRKKKATDMNFLIF